MTTLVLGTSAGNVFVYELGKAIENERILAKKRIDMGVEEDLVVIKLEKSNMKEVVAYMQGAKNDVGFTYSVNGGLAEADSTA